jgi:hypothetical protein
LLCTAVTLPRAAGGALALRVWRPAAWMIDALPAATLFIAAS